MDRYNSLVEIEGMFSAETKRQSNCNTNDYVSLLTTAMAKSCDVFSYYGEHRQAYKTRETDIE